MRLIDISDLDTGDGLVDEDRPSRLHPAETTLGVLCQMMGRY